MADVFISYSRRTEPAFVARLEEALKARNLTSWVDREGILPSSPWRAEIEQAILEAQAVLFVISPASVASPYCIAELERAVALGKRLVPVVATTTPDDLVPAQLAELQFISFVPPGQVPQDGLGETPALSQAEFDRQVDILVEALTTDIESVHFHTHLLTLSQRWAERGNDRSLLLRGRELEEAEKWLDEQSSSHRNVLPQQQRLVRESRQAAVRRQRGSVTAALSIAFAMLILAALAGLEWRVAVNQRHQADDQRDRASSLYVAQNAQSQVSTDPQLSLLLALRAYGYDPTDEAEAAVRAAVSQSALAGTLPETGASDLIVDSQWAVGSDGQWAVSTYAGFNGLAVITVAALPGAHLPRGTPSHFVITMPHSALLSAQFSPDGSDVLALVRRFPSDNVQVIAWPWHRPGSSVEVWSTISPNSFNPIALDHQGNLVAAVESKGTVSVQSSRGAKMLRALHPVKALLPNGQNAGTSALAWSANGDELAAVGPAVSEVWGLPGKGAVKGTVVPVGGADVAAFSPDGTKLAIAEAGPQVDVVYLADPMEPPIVHDLTLPASLGVHSDDVDEALSLAWSPDSTTLAAGTEDPVVLLWPGASTSPFYLPYGSEGPGGYVAFSPEGSLLLDGTLVWDWKAALAYDLGYVSGDLSFSPRGDLVAVATQSGGVALWDYGAFSYRWLVPAPTAPGSEASSGQGYADLTFSPDGDYLAAARGDRVTVWQVAQRRQVAQLTLPNGPQWGGANDVQFTPHGDALVISAQAGVGNAYHDVVLDWQWGTRQAPGQVAFKASNAALAGFVGGEVRILSTPVNATTASRLWLWDGSSSGPARPLAPIPRRDGWTRASALPDQRLLLQDPVGLEVYDLKSKHVAAQFAGEFNYSLSPSDQTVALSYGNGQVDVWDLSSDHPPVAAYSAETQYPPLAWGDGGRLLGIGASSGAQLIPARAYLPFSQVLSVARTLAVTSLTKAQRAQFLP
ncbi:MAG TPA: toll/interleukin-1 receptor domain-containing protein [Acidimicrobiales bacterium]|nr:toll/interleukin-1 receptor domain-containing protein [Acidimicrobiales bacterium]